MNNRLRWLALVLLLIATGALAQDAAIALIPFTNTTFGIQGVVPEGWNEASPGVYARSARPGDFTLVAQQAAPLAPDRVLQALLPQLRLTVAPDSVGERQSGALTWTLYKIEVEAPGARVSVDLGLASAPGGKTLIALLQSAPEERNALYEQVFLPMLAALQPLVETTVESLPYREEAVTFDNGEVRLAGTLTLPETGGPFAAVVLVTGSGPQDRDESLAPVSEIKPFRLIADALTRAGMAVLRYDDRGVGESTGDFEAALTTDFAEDAAAAVAYLRARPDINPSQVGVLGHSEGGIVAAMLGATRPEVGFIITLGGPGVSGAEVLKLQNRRVLETTPGVDPDSIEPYMEPIEAALDLALEQQWDEVQARWNQLIELQIQAMPEDERRALGDLETYKAETLKQQLTFFQSPWMQFFLAHDPADDWAQVTVPVLAIFGGLDVQVDVTQNAPAVEATLEQAGNPDFTVATLPDMNHILQRAVTGGLDEYGTLEPVLHSDLMPLIIDWLAERVDLS